MPPSSIDPRGPDETLEVVVVDYDAGNLRSVRRALEHAGARAIVSDDPRAVSAARAVVLPGVGAASETMEKLRQRRLVEPLLDVIASGRPFLGVCMGMQALFDFSEEGGSHPCLGVLPGRVVRFETDAPVPHMGWNTLDVVSSHPLLAGIESGAHVYFVHSYYPVPGEAAMVVAETEYGGRFASVVARDNVMATQFHPEKSGRTGLAIYANFVTLARARTGAAAGPAPR